jgi:hypothetical protein
MYTYFLILNDYGIRPHTLWGLSILKNKLPRDTDVYVAANTELVPAGTTSDLGVECKQYATASLPTDNNKWEPSDCQYGHTRML